MHLWVRVHQKQWYVVLEAVAILEPEEIWTTSRQLATIDYLAINNFVTSYP